MRQASSKTVPLLAALPLLPVLLSGLLLAGCASGGGGGDSEGERIQELQDRVLELQRKAAVAEVELARLRQQLGELMARQGLSAAPGSGAAPAPYSGDRVAAGSSSRPTQAGPTSPRRPAPPGSSSAGSGAATPAPPVRSPRAPSIDETDIEVPVTQAAPAGAALPGSAGNKGEPATPAVQALYDRGYTLYHQKHYVDAESSFQRFLQAEPGSELADNAQYWIGECRYSRGDMRGALAAFREAVARYPQGNKTPDALLKAGMSLEALGDKEGARNTYQEVLRRFPSTAVAAVAEERRAKLP
jgi:tol-pal system protein YbgF